MKDARRERVWVNETQDIEISSVFPSAS